MGVSYTSAIDRDRKRVGSTSLGLSAEGLLVGVAIVALLVTAATYAGRMRVAEGTDTSFTHAVVDLQTVTEASTLEPAVGLAFAQSADRRLAARELFAALGGANGISVPPNVGALTGIQVSRALIERLPPGSALVARLASAPEGSASVALFTAADLAAVKPAFIVRTPAEHRRAVLLCVIALNLALAAIPVSWRIRRVGGDAPVIAAIWLLVSLGFVVMLSRPDPLRDSLLVVRYTQGVVVGVVAFLAVSAVNVSRLSHLGFSYLPLAGALALAAALALFGSGPGTSGARINLGPVQPMEIVRLLLAVFLAGYFARRWEVVRQVRGTALRRWRLPSWMDVPRPDLVLPVAAAVMASLVLFFLLRDLGPALLLSLTFLVMFAVARARVGLALAGLAVLVAGFYAGHRLGISSTLSARIGMWWSPWENVVRGGDQVAHALWAFAGGAWAGTGVGLGATRFLPAGHTDLALAAIGEELGVAGIATTVVAFGVIAWRGLRIARSASTDYGFFLAMAMSLSLVLPAIVMFAGMTGVVPLTGLVTPFVSYGGSAMVANFGALGLLVACRSSSAESTRHEPFVAPTRWLVRVLGAAAVMLLVVWGRVQVVWADDYLVRPQLGRQADGGVRYQYNPRVLDAARQLPRGTVFDRAGLPLATDDISLARADADSFRRLGIVIDEVCASEGGRCYPLGGAAFHVVGDATTRANWAASNSSYVERDAEGRLRGFDDRAVAVRTGDGGGVAMRRDYAPIVTLVRHRWEPDHPDVRAVLERPRDVTLTIDARLQQQVANILSRAVVSARVKRGAAVVLDAATGHVLASVSYPWPSAGATTAPDATLDRARYGLYPPGSTFKLVTAAAALRAAPALDGMAFVCSRLPDDRVGARIPGYGRPVRDDVRDRHAHGAINLHDGLVRSCNAYFAQLAVHLGADALAATSNLAGIALSPSADPAVVRQNLPHAGYGQGQVVTTPLRLARVAAAIASDGMLRETPVVAEASPIVETRLLEPRDAVTLASFMRDAVTEGTGRLLARHPSRIAGKTGTAEVDGAASHAWFVGFAPHGQAAQQIAFAVILENAGYGGVTAAAAAGEIVAAAASLGLVR